MHNFHNLLKPIKFGSNLIAPNRMYFSSIGFDLCDQQGRPVPEFFEVYESILAGGCGFGFLGNASVDPDSQYTDRSLKLISRSHAVDLRPIIDSARNAGVPLGIQLQHYGQQNTLHSHLAQGEPADASGRTLGTPSPQGDVTSLTEDQIEAYINHFHEAACFALEIGAPAVQIHAANGYLLSSFLSPRTNRRSDRWGGTQTNRARILLEILSRIRDSALDKMAIFVRLQVDDGYGPEGLHVELLEEVVVAIEEAGADAITCATGVAETFGKFLGDREYTVGVTRRAARFLKRKANLPIGFAANVDSLVTAEEILASGDADFIGFGRAIIADHQFVHKELSNPPAAVNRCRWDSFCLRDKKEPLARRVYCCVNARYLRPRHIQELYQEHK
jgi:2,4-dienoyl-CoA reductase-like NADH-dependent reductase (Old Yellow Enzyme family)